MLQEINYLQIVGVCVGLLFACSLIFSLIIEAAKKLLTEETIVKNFGSIEAFSLYASLILGLFVYIIYLLFFIFGNISVNVLDIVRFVFIGIVFMFSCGLGSQVGYDKVIKVLKDIFHIN